MEEENGESEREFPGLYASEASYRSDSDYNENSHERGKKELLRSKKKEKNKDIGYAALDAESSGEEMDYLDIKNPLKAKRPKSFKFLQKKDKEKEEDKKEDKKRKERDEKDDKKKEKKKEKEERKLREKEEKKKIKKDKKKKGSGEDISEAEVNPVFGVPLSIAVERCPSHDGIRLPAIVRECIDFLEEKGLSCEGIYRLGGVKTKVQSLRRAYNAGEAVSLENQQPHVVASLLKQFLRELPETILTVDMMPHFEDVSLIPNPRERAEALRQLIDRLPTSNRLLLQYVLKHMGHVVEKEKETKMSNHNVCVVLSPTMQISHRVLNVMFHSHQHLFGDVRIKRYIPPITSYSGAKRTIDDLRTSIDIEEEIWKQESLLASLHAAIAAGRISQKKEEQLWEAQRIVTLLKRKLKMAQRRETGASQWGRLESCTEKDLSSEESQKEGVCPPPKPPRLNPTHSQKEEEGDQAGDMKGSSESDTASKTTSSSVDRLSRRSSHEEDSEKGLPTSARKKEVPRTSSQETKEHQQQQQQQQQQFPILPKPVSAREERSKLAQSARGKTSTSSIDASAAVGRKKEDGSESSFDAQPPNASQGEAVSARKPSSPVKPLPNMEFQSAATLTNSKEPQIDQDALKAGNAPETPEDEALLIQKPSSAGKERMVPQLGVSLGENRRKDWWKYTQPLAQKFNEETDHSILLQEERRLGFEHEELLAQNHELTRKLQAEKSEISRLRDEIQEIQTLYGYRTHSYDSSESEGSESEGESDTEEDLHKQIITLDKSNKQIKLENCSLTKRIQDERENIIQLKVALRQGHLSRAKVPQTHQVLQVC